MAIVRMNKTSIIALQSDKQKIVEELQKFGSFQVDYMSEDIGLDSANEAASEYDAILAKIRYSLEFIKKHYKVKKGMFAERNSFAVTDRLNEDDISKVVGLYEQYKTIDEKLTELKNYHGKLSAMAEQLEPWKNFDIPIEQIQGGSYTTVLTGSIDKKRKDEFSTELLTTSETLYLEFVGEDKEDAYYFIILLNKELEETTSILKKYNWTKFIFPNLTGRVGENLENFSQLILHGEEKRVFLIEEGKADLAVVEVLEKAFDFLTMERDAYGVVKKFGKTEKTFVIQGWVPTDFAAGLNTMLQAITEFYYMDTYEIVDKEGIPVLLDNPGVIKPLEMITEQYSLPNPQSIDPNKIMAPFYVMFFGMMVSDAGYGIVLAIVTGLALKLLKPQGGMKKLFGLLCLGGLSTFTWGAIFGGWFGVELQPIWFVPMKDPLKMLIFCLILGVIQLYVGMGLQAYSSIKAGRKLDALFDQGLFYLLYTGLMFMILPQVAVIGKWMAIVGAIGIVLTKGRSKKTILSKALSGLLGLYNITGFLSDVLSYSRLFALGLATGVIGSVINSMAAMIGGSFIGNIFMVVLLVFGHTFNIVINVFGAYVHASRLQFIEFFGKFYESGGEAFEPFKIQTKYIEIK